MPKSFSMSIIWKILTGLLLSLSLTLSALVQNQVEWIFPALFRWQHLYVSWWFSWHMLSDMKSWRRSSDLFRRFFQLTRILRLSSLHLNFTIPDSFFLRQWQACKLSGLTSSPVRESALQIFSSSSSSLIDWGTVFTSTDPRRWYRALVTAFLSNWTTFSVSNLLQFLVMARSEQTTSNLLKRSSNQFDKSESFDVISSSDEFFIQFFWKFASWLLVRTILVEDDDRM